MHRSIPLALVVISMIGFLPVAASAADLESPAADEAAAPPARGPFVDDDHSVHEDDIIALAAAGITHGCDPSGVMFCPDEFVSRGQMAAFLRRATGARAVAVDAYADDWGSIYEDDIDALAALDVTVGCAADLYCPDDPMTREQMAAFLARALDLPADPADRFVDDSASPFEAEIDAVAAAGITFGCGEELFCPADPVTRAQMASFLVRAFELRSVPAPAYPDVDDPYLGMIPAAPASAEDWRPLVEEFFETEDVDRALDVMQCESRGDPDAKNPNSTASGLFQHLASHWAGPRDGRAAEAGWAGADVFDPVANTAVAAWLVYEGGGWGHWNASAYCW